MCSLCGILTDKGHWTESAANPSAFRSRQKPETRLRERQARTQLLNRILAPYGLKVSDWGGASYLLRGATGRTAIVAHLNDLWSAAERMTGRPCDPLDDRLLAGLAAS